MELEEQQKVLENTKKNMLVSASAGSGKTYIMIKYIQNLICNQQVPVSDILVLTFTKAAATQMKDRLTLSLKQCGQSEFILQQLDAISTANICTIHAFCDKCLKKYANLLGLNENFSIADEADSLKLHNQAFTQTCTQLEDDEDFEDVLTAFKNNKQKLSEILQQLESLLNSVADKNQFIENGLKGSQKLFDSAAQFLFEDILNNIKQQLSLLEKLNVQDIAFNFSCLFAPLLQSKDIFEMAKNAQEIVSPRLPSVKQVGAEVSQKLKSIKTSLQKEINQILSLNLLDAENVDYQRGGVFEKQLLKIYQNYENNKNLIKQAENVLEFADLEKWMAKLSLQENLFSSLKYVFVDEYQDTNKIQEKIIKNVAKNCNFVAVGDAKQGIYGFRLATSEIFLKDLQDFETATDGQVNFLQSNFRSNQKVLDFVNDIFKVVMTKPLTGIDYKQNSMLKGRAQFVDDNQAAVTVDIQRPQVEPQDKIPEVYSVKDAPIFVDNKNLPLLKNIHSKILQVLGSQISDNGVLRKARYGDIAILSRSRNALYNQLQQYLLQQGMPVVSSSRCQLMAEGEMQMLLGFLQLALCMDDDVACFAVLNSGMYHYPLADIVYASQRQSLCKCVQSEDGFLKFWQDMQAFRAEYLVVGIKEALCNLFAKTNYLSYININNPRLSPYVNQFLQEAERFDFDLPKLIEHLQQAEITVTGEVSMEEDAITLSTIHNSKGLEYPVVFLIGCDQSLSQAANHTDVEINEKFGLALKKYNVDDNSQESTVKLCAIRRSEKKREFVEEIMIFYVALTRAKNRLYLFGFNEFDEVSCIEDADNYFQMIFYALNINHQLLEQKQQICQNNYVVNFIEDVQVEDIGNSQSLEIAQKDAVIAEKIEQYLNFKYVFDESENFTLKETVTNLNNKNHEDDLQKYNNQNFQFASNLVETGNAYHLALKCIDFNKVKNMADLQEETQKNKQFFDVQLIDMQILLKNILVLKQYTVGGKVYKEKEFILKDSLQNLAAVKSNHQILLQGVVDLFIEKQNEIILIDYKYSSQNKQYLIEKYKGQLLAYKNAIESAFNKKVSKCCLLSLKNAQLITVGLNDNK